MQEVEQVTKSEKAQVQDILSDEIGKWNYARVTARDYLYQDKCAEQVETLREIMRRIEREV